MGRRSNNSNQGEKIPEYGFEEMHIAWMWEELHERFGFPPKEWKKRFADHLTKQKRGEDIVGVFLRFGSDNINPILNQILCRNEGHPTWNKLCDFVVKKKR